MPFEGLEESLILWCWLKSIIFCLVSTQWLVVRCRLGTNYGFSRTSPLWLYPTDVFRTLTEGQRKSHKIVLARLAGFAALQGAAKVKKIASIKIAVESKPCLDAKMDYQSSIV